MENLENSQKSSKSRPAVDLIQGIQYGEPGRHGADFGSVEGRYRADTEASGRGNVVFGIKLSSVSSFPAFNQTELVLGVWASSYTRGLFQEFGF